MKKILIILVASLVLVLAGCKSSPVEPKVEFIMNAGQDTVEINAIWIDEGAYLLANYREFEAISSGTVDTSVIGLYIIEYTITQDEIDYSLTRYVNVVDQIAPVISIQAGIDTVIVGNTWNDAGTTVTDNSLEELIVTVAGNVNTSVIGTYEITYSAIDSSGNTTTEIRYINVIQ